VTNLAPSKKRLEYLTEYLMEQINDADGVDFTIQTGEGEFAWVSPEDQEVVLVKLQPAQFVAAGPPTEQIPGSGHPTC
jgi:hypothetical protein